MSNTLDTTIRVQWSPAPGSPEALSSNRRLSKLAAAALHCAWLSYIAALFLPAAVYTPGYLCLLGSAVSVVVLCLGSVSALVPALLFIPNLAMLLSPMVLARSVRRGRMMQVLSGLSVAGAILTVSCGALICSQGLDTGGCGGTGGRNSDPEIGFFMWVVSAVFLAAGTVLARRSEGAAK
ncbi:MAG: hypothetical protein AAB074_15770 [Planctomycetota bacterium]